jgi:hypothetical protein
MFPLQVWIPVAALGVIAIVAIVNNLALLPSPGGCSIGYQLREDDLLFRRGIMCGKTQSASSQCPTGACSWWDISNCGRSPAGLSEPARDGQAAAGVINIPGLTEAEAEELRGPPGVGCGEPSAGP